MDLEQYLTALASSAPAPGGGSAAAVSALIGISTMMKAAVLTKDKKSYAPYAELYEQACSAWTAARQDITAGAAADEEAFKEVMHLYKAPAEVGPARQQALDAALMHAGRVPLQVGHAIIEVLEGAQLVCDHISPWVVSDLLGGLEIVQGALRAVLLNTAINAASIKDIQLQQVLTDEMVQCKHEAETIYQNLVNRLYAKETFAELRSVSKEKGDAKWDYVKT